VARTVALIGIGAMGSGVGRCLLEKGFAVRGFDVRSSPLTSLGEAGAVVCGSPAEAADGADAVVLLVLNTDQVADVVFGERGLHESLATGAPIVCAVTMAAARAKALAEQAQQAGYRWLDAPVSGGTVRARDGTLTSMVGASEEDLNLARPILEAYSKDIFHLGPVGAGSTAKMVNQVLVYCHLVATAEAMTLCRKLGVDGQAVYDVICTAMGASAIFASRVPRILDGTYESGGSLRIALKDLAIVEETARGENIPMPMSALALQLFRATAASGGIDQDDLVIARLYEQLAGLSQAELAQHL
jgi:putative dehydrogenase